MFDLVSSALPRPAVTEKSVASITDQREYDGTKGRKECTFFRNDKNNKNNKNPAIGERDRMDHPHEE